MKDIIAERVCAELQDLKLSLRGHKKYHAFRVSKYFINKDFLINYLLPDICDAHKSKDSRLLGLAGEVAQMYKPPIDLLKTIQFRDKNKDES